MKKIIISVLIILFWLIVIFCFSNTPSKESNNQSKKTIYKVVETTINTTNTIGITNTKLTKEKINKITEKLNYPFRKCMHASVYFVLALILLITLNKNNITGYKAYIFTIIFCFIYAITDEYHQLYVEGRTGQILDVFIDTIGASISLLIYKITSKTKPKAT